MVITQKNSKMCNETHELGNWKYLQNTYNVVKKYSKLLNNE